VVSGEAQARLSGPKPKILLGVTVDMSLGLMRGFPEYLVSQGWEVHVVSSPGPGLNRLALLDGVSAHPLTMSREPSLLRDLRALIAWIVLLRRVRPDLISVGTPKAGLLGSVAGRLAGTRHRVYMLRGLRLETATGFGRRILAAIERLSISSADRVVSVSPSLRARAIGLGLVRDEKIVVLGSGSSNGVNLQTFDRGAFSEIQRASLSSRLGLIPGLPVVGFVGRLTRDKGLNVLAEARMILAREGVDYQLLVVGGVEDTSGSAAFDGGPGKGRPAVVTGHVSDPEIYYQVMDILCLPTLREGFPNVVLEAAAASVPTVTTTATGAIDSVIDGETGLISQSGSARSLADQLAVMIEDGARREAMGHRAAEFVAKEFSQQRVWSLTEGFYRDIIAGSGSTTKGSV
jgi:glycosyltransferase involved in cell wall biosynthesis